MFSLIITIISVALVAALALATLYYGGDAFNQGRAKANAARVANQGQQLVAAADLFRANRGRYPDSIAELVSTDYLKSVPMAKRPIAEALADTAWVLPAAGLPVFTLAMPEGPTCQQVNVTAYGLDGVLPTLYPEFSTQCAGPTSGPYLVVVAKAGQQLDELTLPLVVEAAGTPLPSEDAATGWTIPPGGRTPATAPAEPDPVDPDPVVPEVIVQGTLATPSLDFGRVLVGASATQTAQLQSTGDGPLQVASATPFAAAFQASVAACGSVAAGDACDIPVVFTPTVGGALSGQVALQSNDAGSPHLLEVSGFGFEAAKFHEGGLTSGNATLASSFAANNTSLNSTGTAWTVNARPAGLSKIGIGLLSNANYMGGRQYLELTSTTYSAWVYLVGKDNGLMYGVALDGSGCVVGSVYNGTCTTGGNSHNTRLGMLLDYATGQMTLYRNGVVFYQAPVSTAQPYMLRVQDRDVDYLNYGGAILTTREFRVFNMPSQWQHAPSNVVPFSQQ